MFRDAIFRVGSAEFVLPIREYEIRLVERDYGAVFVRWCS